MAYLKLDPAYMDPRTQMPMPQAVLVIFDTEFRLRTGDTRVIGAVYSSPSVIGIAEPVEEIPIALSPAERDSQLPALLNALYQVILARPEYRGASFVP